MTDTTDRMYDLLREANALIREPLRDDERRAACMAAKRELIAELIETRSSAQLMTRAEQ